MLSHPEADHTGIQGPSPSPGPHQTRGRSLSQPRVRLLRVTAGHLHPRRQPPMAILWGVPFLEGRSVEWTRQGALPSMETPSYRTRTVRLVGRGPLATKALILGKNEDGLWCHLVARVDASPSWAPLAVLGGNDSDPLRNPRPRGQVPSPRPPAGRWGKQGLGHSTTGQRQAGGGRGTEIWANACPRTLQLRGPQAVGGIPGNAIPERRRRAAGACGAHLQASLL